MCAKQKRRRAAKHRRTGNVGRRVGKQRVARQRRNVHKGGRRAAAPATAEQIANNIRGAIRRHIAGLSTRINRNRHDLPTVDIMAAFGADATALNAYLAAGATLSAVTPAAATAPAPTTPVIGTPVIATS
jgi:hypothetical protein